MRGRRNTNLSITSLPLGTADVSPVIPAPTEDNEKGRFLWIPAQPIDPDLPSPLLKHEKETRELSLWSRVNARVGVRRIATIILSFFLLAYVVYQARRYDLVLTRSHVHHYELQHYAADLGRPGPVLVQDETGRKGWTMANMDKLSFPLRPFEYLDICRQSQKLSKDLRKEVLSRSRIAGKGGVAGKLIKDLPYYANDGTYIDVGEAQQAGFGSTPDASSPIKVVGRNDSRIGKTDQQVRHVCDTSMTVVLESDNVGFGHSLLTLWLSYGLAKREGRSFFIDDTRWQYGDYLSYFSPPPTPNCVPPPSSHIVPYPRQAKHLVVSTATVPFVFGSSLNDYFEDKLRPGVHKQREIFKLLRRGYEDLFSLIGEDAEYAAQRISALRTENDSTKLPLIGMHIRRGDRHPHEHEFSRDYLPLERYTTSALALAHPLHADENTSTQSFLLASDDPDILTSPDLLSTLPSAPSSSDQSPITLQRVQDRIVLASKRTLPPSHQIHLGPYTKHVPEVNGWEGGFFASLFTGLGRAESNAGLTFSSAREFRAQREKKLAAMSANRRADRVALPGEESEEERNGKTLKTLVGRGYLLDLEVLSKADGVVCAVSSASCRVLGVMMGWDKVKGGQWVNVDDGRAWSWDGNCR